MPIDLDTRLPKSSLLDLTVLNSLLNVTLQIAYPNSPARQSVQQALSGWITGLALVLRSLERWRGPSARVAEIGPGTATGYFDAKGGERGRLASRIRCPTGASRSPVAARSRNSNFDRNLVGCYAALQVGKF